MELLSQGMTRDAVAQEVGIGVASVYRFLQGQPEDVNGCEMIQSRGSGGHPEQHIYIDTCAHARVKGTMGYHAISSSSASDIRLAEMNCIQLVLVIILLDLIILAVSET